ncbi:MAG TPA: hypothetical protein VGS22_13920 [Thermoanaerobaculia bacterium]|jgi:hypothetical protein|nr:hypothetical protein [Thermoanaerobaculia bacterium]
MEMNQRVQIPGHRPWIAVAGLALCLGLWACGGGHEESKVDSASAVATPTPPEPGVPNEDAATNSDVIPDPAFSNLPPVEAQAAGKGMKAHLALTGDQKFEADATSSNCALQPNKTLQVGINIPRAPFFVLQIQNFHGAGEYDADSKVRANYSGEVFLTSSGVAKTTITVVKSAQPGGADAISGTFAGPYEGRGGKGNVSGSFENCLYKLPEFTQ